MMVEQAFHALPEVLLGNQYPLQEYEAGVVVAFTHALLQELNGRNVPNPIACLQAERAYWREGFPIAGDKRRYLRADLFVNLSSLRVSNKSLDLHGWRHNHWLEAKFYRNDILPSTGHSTNKAAHSAGLLGDLVRLAALVPEKPEKYDKTVSGRYLLHVYDEDPKRYVAYRKNKSGDSPGFGREWLKRLHQCGRQTLDGFRLDEENESFLAALGKGITDVELEFEITNFVIVPNLPEATRRKYWCVLSRIDRAEIAWQDMKFGFNFDRQFIYRDGMEGNPNDYVEIRIKVGQSIGVKPSDMELSAGEEPPDFSGDEEEEPGQGPEGNEA